MEGGLVASMYMGDEVAWLDFKVDPKIIVPTTNFDNNRRAADQTVEVLKQTLREAVSYFLEQKGIISAKIVVIEGYDSNFHVNTYDAFYIP